MFLVVSQGWSVIAVSFFGVSCWSYSWLWQLLGIQCCLFGIFLSFSSCILSCVLQLGWHVIWEDFLIMWCNSWVLECICWRSCKGDVFFLTFVDKKKLCIYCIYVFFCSTSIYFCSTLSVREEMQSVELLFKMYRVCLYNT